MGNVSASFAPGELTALTGPPGAGKSLLLQLLAGVRPPTFGEVVWADAGSPRPAIAYRLSSSPGLARAQRHLTPAEQVETALRLRVAGLDRAARQADTAALLEKTGLADVASRPASTLTRDQQRRLALAVELTGSPGLLLWDESDESFDPETELEFLQLLRRVARQTPLAAIRVTHALDRLGPYDSVLVLHGGQLAYEGPPEFLTHYFQLENTDSLYHHLSLRSPDDWHRSWAKHGSAYRSEEALSLLAGDADRQRFLDKHRPGAAASPAPSAPLLPGAFSQFSTLLRRRWRLAWRDLPAMGRKWTLFFAFPCAVALWAAGDLPWFAELSGQLKGNVVEQLKENAVFAVDATHGVGLATGLAMAQMILLAFLAAQNAAREIAGERSLLEAEKYRGLRVRTYVASKAAFLFPWVVAQAAWMGAYVHGVCRLPGDLGWQIAVLVLVNAAFTALCLAVSSFARTASRAHRVCFALAALQLPLSGAVLSPPESLSWIVRPLVPLYWGTSAYLQSMAGTRFYEVLQILTPLSPAVLCFAILAAQTILGLGMAVLGCKLARLGVVRHPSGT